MFKRLKNRYVRRITDKQGGEKTSTYLRDITEKEYKVKVGMHSYGGCFRPDFNTGGRVTIGRYCSFAPNIRYFGGNHPINYASTTPYFYQKSWGGCK